MTPREKAESAGIILEKGRFYYGMAHVSVNPSPPMPNGGDMLFCLWQYDREPEKWHLTYRFRYNVRKDGEPWDDDRKSWYEATLSGTSKPELITKLRDAVEGIAAIYPGAGKPDWVIADGDCERMMEAMVRSGKSWLHIKAVNLDGTPAAPPVSAKP